MGVDLQGQSTRLRTLGVLFLVTAVLHLLFSLDLTSRVLGQWYLLGVPEGGVFGKANGVDCCHPALHESEIPGLEDNRACGVFSILEALVVVGLLSGLLPTLVVRKLCL